ncbi:MAG TPA: hypothetical protein VFK38_07815 [Candidatus Limnocylindrales bacterium]|nr:hypothetical protein [Candidatus Limnocylindrales bacterium]
MTAQPSATPGYRLPGQLAQTVEAATARALEEAWARRIWERDTSLWSSDPGVQSTIAQRLGWLDAPAGFRDRVDALEAFAAGVRAEGFSGAVVCGMGGSSLAPEVLARSHGPSTEGIPVSVLDSTDPEAVLAVRAAADPRNTLYIVASKSGSTTETLAFLDHLWQVEDELHGSIPDSRPGEHFVAITDTEETLGHFRHADAFRGVFLNPPDVGGRYSALTYVGLVPAALLGLDLRALLADAERMAQRCRDETAGNPGLALGLALGALAREGRDKLTLVIEPALAALGPWLEQLVAESTGKRGTGIVPVDGEPLAEPEAYGPDRVFVRIRHDAASDWSEATDAMLAALSATGHPVIDLPLSGGEGLGGEFLRWEFATAVAGAVLGVDPFDEPNVTESKQNTVRVLQEYADRGSLPVAEPFVVEGPLALHGDAPLRLTAGPGDLVGELGRHLARARPLGYISLQAYLAPRPARDEALAAMRLALRAATGLATTVGYGPRFLHSTGQLHKGGPRNGCFIQLVAGHPRDVAIPGRDLTFGVLIDAQALGDFASLESHDLPVLRVHLGDDPDAGLRALAAALEAALAARGG